MNASLTKKQRLRSRAAIQQLFASRSVSIKGCRILWKKNNEGITRILVVPIRKYGNAVERNKIKRIGREIFRVMQHSIKPGYDIAWMFYPGSYSYDDRVYQVTRLLNQNGMLVNIQEAAEQ